MKTLAIIATSFAITGAAAAMPPPTSEEEARAEADALRTKIMQLVEAHQTGAASIERPQEDTAFTPPAFGTPEYHAMMAMRCLGPPAPLFEELRTANATSHEPPEG